ncbi:MAG: histidine kinase [Leptospiraceae bacterium]|nr:histidine kinase [Leptospiraceae bacterium]
MKNFNAYIILACFFGLVPFFLEPIFDFCFEKLENQRDLADGWYYNIDSDSNKKEHDWKKISLPYEYTNNEERVYFYHKIKIPKNDYGKETAIYFEYIEHFYEVYLEGKRIAGNFDFTTKELPKFHTVTEAIIIPFYEDASNKELIVKIVSDWGRVGINGIPKIGKRFELEKFLFRKAIGFLIITFIYSTIATVLFLVYQWNQSIVLIRDLGLLSLISAFVTFYHFPAKTYLTDKFVFFFALGFVSLSLYPSFIYRIYNLILFKGENKKFQYLSIFYFIFAIYTYIFFFTYKTGYYFFMFAVVPFYTMRTFDMFYLVYSLLQIYKTNSYAKILFYGVCGLSLSVFPSILFQLGILKNFAYFSHLGFYFVLLSFLVSLALKIRNDILEKERVQLELMLKSIHPHFLTNTLNTAIAWVRENPKKTSELLFSISRFLRAMLDLGQRRFISIEEEIQLCKDYLKIMEFRFGKKFKLNLVDCTGKEQIPPFIIHTLVENSFKHKFQDQNISLYLRKETHSDRDFLLFYSNRKVEPDLAIENIQDGIGFRYIKICLKEAYGNSSKLSIEINKNNQFQVRMHFDKKILESDKV